MAKKAKKTAARRKSARKPARRLVKLIRGTASIGTRVVPTFEILDPVRILNGGTVGVVTGITAHFKEDPDYSVRVRSEDGVVVTRYFPPGDLAHA